VTARWYRRKRTQDVDNGEVMEIKRERRIKDTETQIKRETDTETETDRTNIEGRKSRKSPASSSAVYTLSWDGIVMQQRLANKG